MSMSESYEPMQVDAEENDNDEGDMRMVAEALAVPLSVGTGISASFARNILSDGAGEEAGVNYNIENPTIDLETYTQGYSGLGRLFRLKFIAKHCSSLRVEALKLAIHHASSTYNVQLYSELQKQLLAVTGSVKEAPNLPDVAVGGGGGGGPSTSSSGLPQSVMEWIETKNRKAALKLEKLDTDLKNYRSNSIKESIRRGHDDLGDHFLDSGDLSNALKCYSRARDYCTTGRHVVNMCVNVIRVSVYLQNWSHVVSFVNKAMATPDFADGASKSSHDHHTVVMGLTCCAGLADLAMRNYKSAAKRFITATLDYCDMPDIMSTQNIATYGGLCALATFERGDLHKKVITSSTFKLFLEQDPQLREVITNFHGSKYGKCLKLLDDIKDNLKLDMYLARHVNNLYTMIRNRSLVQYFSPYLSADLRLMASSLNTTVSDLEDELMALILDGQIQARIDSHNKVLFSQDVDQRNVTFEHAVEMANLYQRRARMLILRSAILKRNVMVKGVSRSGGGSGQQNNEQAEGNN